MDKENSELIWKNYQIIQENERLRRMAQRLNQENQALLSQLKQRLTGPESSSGRPNFGHTSTGNQTKSNPRNE
ncbi:hypothetical protein DM860_005526 [Cuscuta australis]|uniref:Protein LITTLE ZIPPER 4 n=1 Tax=Cuscuta australis TaxID=267555 RepID=A0A328E105_9ASTE|nr:hypothetical protein DM860_005526 [Cuscuta australis]